MNVNVASQDYKLSVLRAGRAQLCSKFTIFMFFTSKNQDFLSGFRIAYILSLSSERAVHNYACFPTLSR